MWESIARNSRSVEEMRLVPSITLIGAGPVGSLLSIFLAKRGYQVDIIERRPDMRCETVDRGRSINLAVSIRGLHALSKAGLKERVLEHAITMPGRMMHSMSSLLTFQPYGLKPEECIYSIARADLNAMLMDTAESEYGVRIHFNNKVVDYDVHRSTLVIDQYDRGKTTRPTEGPVIGTDGSASVIRARIAKAQSSQVSEDLLNYGYREFTIPPSLNGEFQLEPHALHIWPRGSFMLIALPNFDRSFTCTLFLSFEGAQSLDSFETFDSFKAFFVHEFPDAYPLAAHFEREFEENPVGKMVTVKCYPWSFGGKTLLMGDAAHAIVPFFGQGMNCGFEDCVVLDELLSKHGSNWKQVFEEFEHGRKPDTDAIADMAIENFTEMRDKVGDRSFLIQKEVEKILHREFGDAYIPRYSMVTFSRVPYRFALSEGKRQDQILHELCADLKKPEDVDLSLAKKLLLRAR